MKVVIIGGVAGGASTAARLRRMDEHARIIMLEKGPYISYANCGLPYYIGEIIPKRDKLFVQTPQSFGKRFNIDVRVLSEAIQIDRQAKTVTIRDLKTGSDYTETYDKLVLSPGAEPVRPPLPGIDDPQIFTLRTVSDTDKIKSYLDENPVKRAVVIGAGFIGLEMAENLHHRGLEVAVVEMAPQVMTPVDFPIASIVHHHFREKKVGLYLNQAVSRFDRVGGNLIVTLNSGVQLPADLVILSIGVRPDSRLAANSGLELGVTRGIKVNEYLQTSDPDIYAVGDAIEFVSPVTGKPTITYLAGPANKQGRICANNIVTGNTERYKGSIGTAIAKVFDLTVGTTGASAALLRREGIEFAESITHSGSHAGYYPGADTLTLKINFDPVTGRLLGGQVVGRDGVDKRTDLLASVIRTGGTIADLTDIEHAYAPPFSSAKDPVNMAGFVAENIMTRKIQPIQWDELKSILDSDTSVQLIDVRSPSEVAGGSIQGAVNIPVDDLRNQLDRISKNKPTVIYCAIGLRGYLASRILLQSGYSHVRNLSGGFKTWDMVTCEQSNPVEWEAEVLV
ncbi:MAG: FAD-dependent oxidoreductase [Bacteroidetes bacterium]|nr:FAD-dependent oxidoreductase [Bacteroidota bacterium]